MTALDVPALAAGFPVRSPCRASTERAAPIAAAQIANELRSRGNSDLPFGVGAIVGRPTGPSRPETLPKEARVRRRSEYLALGRVGRRTATRHFLLVWELAGEGPARLGITVTRKIGNAVVRNRIKRAVRETFRRCRVDLPAGLSVVVIARNGAGELGSLGIAEEIGPALAGLARSPAPGSGPGRGTRP